MRLWSFLNEDILKMSTSSLGYLQQHQGHVWLVPAQVLKCEDPSTACPIVPGHCCWGQSASDPWFRGSLREEMCARLRVHEHRLKHSRFSLKSKGLLYWEGDWALKWLPAELVQLPSHKCFPWSSRKGLPGETGRGWALQVRDLVQKRDSQRNLTHYSSKGKQAFRCMLTKLFIPKLWNERGVTTPRSENRNQQQCQRVLEQR